MALDIVWTRRAMRLPEEVREEVARRLRKVHRHFPEAPRRLKVGLTRFCDGLAYQSRDSLPKLMLDIRRTRQGSWRYPTYWTLGHELMHLAQFNSEGVPSGERATDMFALARLPPELIDEPPSYLVIRGKTRSRWGRDLAALAHRLAKEAIIRRSAGALRNYASWWEKEFNERTAQRARARAPDARGARPSRHHR